jgi:hypothetical protein
MTFDGRLALSRDAMHGDSVFLPYAFLYSGVESILAGGVLFALVLL